MPVTGLEAKAACACGRMHILFRRRLTRVHHMLGKGAENAGKGVARKTGVFGCSVMQSGGDTPVVVLLGDSNARRLGSTGTFAAATNLAENGTLPEHAATTQISRIPAGERVDAVVVWTGANERGCFNHGAWATLLRRVVALGCPVVVIGLVVEPTGSGRRRFDVNEQIEAAVSGEKGCMFLQLEAAEKSRSVDGLHLEGFRDGGDDLGDDYDRLAERVTHNLAGLGSRE